MKNLDLEMLGDGISTGLSVGYGVFLAEAAAVVLNAQGHSINSNLLVEGDISQNYHLTRKIVDELATNSFGDLEEATQFGAMGIAVGLIYSETGWKVRRSYKGTGFDFWFGDMEDGFLFQDKLRVEVSGDMEGNQSEIQQRLKTKLEQTKKSDDLGLPACAVIIEFSHPRSLIQYR